MEKKQLKKKKTELYVIGSIAFATGVAVLAPKIIDFIAKKIDKPSPQIPINDEDWGPEIVRKADSSEENNNGEL